jgi:prepilin-type N-terminal cleavage/methylation domain-containing protein
MVLNIFSRHKHEKGFTLVEILVSLLILGLILVGLLPLLTMANRIMYQNRDQLVAIQLARQEIETISSMVTPQNYNEPDGPLTTGVYDRYLNRNLEEVDPDSPDRVYTVTTAIGWVDDSEDGEAPTDPIPFDYKYLQVTVSAPSIFTGQVTERTDFKTYRAREGAADPISGVLIQVERAWRDDPAVAPPVEGATVTVTSASGGSVTGLTDDRGRALIELTPSGTDDIATYHIGAAKSGMILHPSYPYGIEQEINRYSTEMVVLQMEEPTSIRLSLNKPHYGGIAVLSGGDLLPQGQPLQATLAANDQQVDFSSLWPAGPDGNISGSYSLKVYLLIYRNEYKNEEDEIYIDDFTRWEADDSLWEFDESENKWTAIPIPGQTYTEYNRLGLAITGLNRFLPGSGFSFNFPGEDIDQIALQAHEFTIDSGSEDPNAYSLIYKSGSELDLAEIITGDENWEGVATLQQALEAAENLYDDKEIRLKLADLEKDTLKLRFDTSPNIEEITFGPLSIQVCYTHSNIVFSSPGQSLTLTLFADNP